MHSKLTPQILQDLLLVLHSTSPSQIGSFGGASWKSLLAWLSMTELSACVATDVASCPAVSLRKLHEGRTNSIMAMDRKRAMSARKERES
eukprot:CAMPEP_0181423624 /NCGR_PEP_ID=MMETSP1110-20121109/14223_1 /TAXON_ID=174948 /ORGANISM="Symbiodinium sp., Strain CCMP421" /LENGTH=89 /DNA_ID=CAMNT_0023546753 /DNA_START=109 /DNA_END=378 /DNA_ORIENTATION=+